ncbi:hypothetical protein LP420_10405 [Massilia sp. B-10]|nr:hypothetical protein LP420_10405 [Massilia sp. B-10]
MVVEHAEDVEAVGVEVTEAARDVGTFFVVAVTSFGRSSSPVMVVVVIERLVMKLITPPIASVP